MNEIARFQRLSSVSLAASVFHEGDERPAESAARPVRPSSVVVVRESLGDPPEQSGRVDAVVVGKRDDVGAHVLERDVPRSRQARLRLQVNELQRPSDEEIGGAQVVVLVDDDDPQRRVVLSLERVEEATELVRPSDRRDDEVERRKLPRHGP